MASIKNKIVAFGDSIVKGVVLDADGYTISRDNFVDDCAIQLGTDVRNYGRFGSTVSMGNTLIDKYLRVIKPGDKVLLEYGGNDSDHKWNQIASYPMLHHGPNTDLATFAKTYKEIISKIVNRGGKPVLLSLPPVDSKRFFEHITRSMDQEHRANILSWLGGDIDYIASWHQTYNLEVFKIAASAGVPVVDITTAFLQQKDFSLFFCEDGIHPNEEGQKLICNTVCAALA